MSVGTDVGSGDGAGNGGDRREPPRPEDLGKTLERLDALLASTRDLERLRMGMGIRLALGMAQEMRQGAPLGSRTGGMVAAWTEEHGQDSVDMAVRIAREFLTKPEELRKALAKRLAPDGGSEEDGEESLLHAEGGSGAVGGKGIEGDDLSSVDLDPGSEGPRG